VRVTAGPPFGIDIDVNDEGEDIGGGAWLIEVSARIWDRYRNPVSDRIPVWFTVEPQVANIDPAFTGNENRAGEIIPGMAFTNLVYQSRNTFRAIEISALVHTEDGEIEAHRDHILPLQEGTLELNVDPANWMFDVDREIAEIRCWVTLNDGQALPLNGAPILFSSNRAAFGWRDPNDQMRMFYPDPVRMITGLRDQLHDEEPGQATVFLVAEEGEIFLDPFGNEMTVQIDAYVEGFQDVSARPQFIFFTRE